MAFDLPTDTQDAARYTVVSAYTVNRLGDAPSVSIAFEEVCFVFDATGTVDSVEDIDADGVSEVLHVSAFGSLDPAALIGKPIALGDSTSVSAVKSAAVTQVNGANSMALTLDLPLAVPVAAGATIGVVRINGFGGPVYRKPSRGRAWQLVLSGANAPNAAQMQQSMGAILASAISAGVTALGLTATSDQIAAAVTALAQKGVTIDSLWADAAAQIELARRAGTFVPTGTMGTVPAVEVAS